MIKKTLTLLSALLAASLLSAPAQEISSPWKGARVAFLGDSITDQRQLATQDIFWHQLEQILGIQPYVYGISGHRCKHIKGQAEKLYDEHGTDVDAIIIFVGTNDFNGSIPPGEWYSEETAWSNRNGREVQLKHRTPILTGGTVRSDINIFLSYIKHTFPTQQVILLTPLHRAYFNASDTNIQPDEGYANALGYYVDTYVDIIKEAGNVWAVPVIDMNSLSGLYPLEPEHVRYFREAGKDPEGVRHDLLHPNTEGQLRMAYTLAYQLLTLPPKF